MRAHLFTATKGQGLMILCNYLIIDGRVSPIYVKLSQAKISFRDLMRIISQFRIILNVMIISNFIAGDGMGVQIDRFSFLKG